MPCVYAATPARLHTKLKRRGMRGRGIREQDAEDAKDTQKAQKNTKIFKCESRARPHSTQPQTHKSLASSVYAGYREFMGCKAHGGWLSWFCSLLAQGNAGGVTQRAQRLRRGSKRIQKYSNEKAEPDRIKPSANIKKYCKQCLCGLQGIYGLQGAWRLVAWLFGFGGLQERRAGRSGRKRN